MSDLISLTKVYIIESPSSTDILDNRNEGEALSKVLTLFNIKHSVFRVTSIDTLRASLLKISEDIIPIKSSFGAVHLHFSLHGYKGGIALTNDQLIQWPEFYTIMKEFNDKIGYIELPGIRIAPTYLSFSVCEGFSARIIRSFGKESPYTALIGPKEPVSWADAVLAYSLFFHITIVKKFGTKKALELMNSVVGKAIFDVDLGTGMTLK